jgi:hypothetical protein
VQAWVYTILNPLIESLRREARLLEKGNLTWRWYSRRCEYIRPIVEYVDSSHGPNYEDFLADEQNAGFGGRFEKHDQALAEVESTASQFFSGLMGSDMFQEQVERSLRDYDSNIAEPGYPSLNSMKADLPKYIAEYLINRTEILPHHYTAHKFWEGYRLQFGLLTEEFEGYQQRTSFRAVEKASHALKDLSVQLLEKLENHRLFLCSTFDIPAAPIDPNLGHSGDAIIE